MRSTYLEASGISRYETCYDQSGNPIEDKLGVAMIRRIWDPVDRVEIETYHNLQGELVEILYGFCEVRYRMYSSMELQSAYCYNKRGDIVEEQYKYS